MSTQPASLRRRSVIAFSFSLLFAFLSACTGTPPLDLSGAAGTAGALAQTAQSGGGTALAEFPATATALAATAGALAGTAQAVAGTAAANVTDLAPTAVALVTQAGDVAETAQAFATEAKVD